MPEMKAVGVIADRYEVRKVLVQNALFCRVFEVHDRKLDRILAAKVQVDNRDGFREHFLAAARTWMEIPHKNLVAIHDAGMSQWGAYCIMELLEGKDLQQLLAEKNVLPWDTAKPLFLQACDGLDALHEMGIVHRSLAPYRIFLNEASEGVSVKLLGFSIIMTPKTSFPPCKETFIGVPEYAAPEQVNLANGARVQLDRRLDIYALGTMMYRALTGVVPFQSVNLVETLMGRLHELPGRPSSINPRIPNGVDSVVLQALECNPNDRFQTAIELKAAILAI